MANLMPAWNVVRIFGTWTHPDQSPEAAEGDWVRSAGTYTVSYPGRITNSVDDNMWAGGGIYEEGILSIDGGEESLDIMIPATDDPDIEQSDLTATISIMVNGVREVYVIEVPMAARPVETGGTGAGVNLRTIALAEQIAPATAFYGVGTPGGLAKLSSDGLSVVDKDGVPIVGGGGGGGAVASVNGRIGTVTLSKADVGLTNADNTSDANKPVSTAAQTALNLKANLASPALTGTPTVPTAAPGTNTTQAASTAFVEAAVDAIPPGGGASDWGDLGGTLSDQTDLQAALDAKAASSHTHAATGISDSTSVGRAVMTAVNAGAARSAISASDLVIGTTGSTAMAGNTTLADLGGTPTVVLTQAAYDLIAPGVPGVLYVVSG